MPNKREYKGIKRCVVAFSGGLDSTVISHMLCGIGIEVIGVTVDVGQGREVLEIDRIVRKMGIKNYVIDAKEEFFSDFICRAIRANFMYGGMPHPTALSRPLIVKHLVDVARLENAQAVAHGSTGKGNDQVRIDNGIRALAPELRIIAPVRDWGLWRDEEIEYAKKKGLPVRTSKTSPYAIDQNIWGREIKRGVIDGIDKPIPENVYKWSRPKKSGSCTITLFFNNGLPACLVQGNKKYYGADIVVQLNSLAGNYGIGRFVGIQDKLVGIKRREVCEAPAAHVILTAHSALETAILTKSEIEVKRYLEGIWGELVYFGLWYSPLREEIDAFINMTQRYVEGKVRIRLSEKSVDIVGIESRYAIYDEIIAGQEKEKYWSNEDAGSFAKMYGLQDVFAKLLRESNG
ncbi:MAG: argininosuccinate synthase [Candidatus Micrarchaeia archaeon]